MSASPFDDVMQRFLACPTLGQRQIDWLRAREVPASAISDPDELACADVYFRGCRFGFPGEMEDAGAPEAAVVLLLRDEVDGCPIDLAAWSPRSGRVATWC